MEKVAILAAEVMAIKTTEAGSTAGLAVAAVVVVVAAGAMELAELNMSWWPTENQLINISVSSM